MAKTPSHRTLTGKSDKNKFFYKERRDLCEEERRNR